MSRKRKSRSPRSKPAPRSRPLSLRQQEEKVRCFAAINRIRRGEAKTVSAAARAEGTTVRAIRALVPKAITQDRPGGRIRVKPTDRYSARVEILAKEVGPKVVTARGSRQRNLAGQHRGLYNRVLKGVEPPSALAQFRGKKVGGYELVSDFDELSIFAQAGFLSQLDSLYASPETSF
jgi:hypothetical protein